MSLSAELRDLFRMDTVELAASMLVLSMTSLLASTLLVLIGLWLFRDKSGLISMALKVALICDMSRLCARRS